MEKKYKEINGKNFVWVQAGPGGYWSQIEDEEDTQYRIPLCCPACTQLLMNRDNKSFLRFGVCQDCEIMWVEDRNLSKELIRNRKALVSHVKLQIEERNSRIKTI